MTQRFEGKNLDEALTHAAEALGVGRDQIKHAVLLEKRGFLGGVKRVVIEAEVNPHAAPPAAPAAQAPAPSEAAPVASATPAVPPVSQPAVSRDRTPRSRGGAGRTGGGPRGGHGGGGGGGGRRGGRNERGGRGGGGGGRRRERPMDDLQVGDFERFAAEIPEQGPQSDAAKTVRAWCDEVLDLARFDLDLRTEENDTQIIVRLYGPDTRRLTEHHGELLDALQVLANKSLGGRKVEKDIELDCEAFKERRVEELEQQARRMADRVREDGREYLLPAMSPIERRIVHMALRDDPEVTTESRGDGFYKRVALILRADEPAPARTGDAQPTES